MRAPKTRVLAVLTAILAIAVITVSAACASSSQDQDAGGGAPMAVAVDSPKTAAAPEATPSPESAALSPTPSPSSTPAPSPTPQTPTPAPSPETAEPSPTPAPAPTPNPTPTSSPTPETAAPTETPTPAPTAAPASASSPPPAPPDLLALVPPNQIPAPALAGLEGWINSPDLTLDDLAGKTVLLDFWTYTCVNCVRTLPYLKDWHRKYAGEGLAIIGVHTPEFDFEKIPENVARAASDFGLEYPIAQDNDYATWRAYRVEAWPSKYIVDGAGFVRYYHRGEGAYADTERVIRYLLAESGRDLSDITPDSAPDPLPIAGSRSADMETFQTREIYGGALRNIAYGGAYILNENYYESARAAADYVEPDELRNHFIALHGRWFAAAESIDHARTTAGYEDYIALRFFANEVNAVMGFDGGAPYAFRVTLDGEPVPQDAAGADLAYDANGESVVSVDSPRMYQLIRREEVASNRLTLSPKGDRFSLFALTFGAYPVPAR